VQSAQSLRPILFVPLPSPKISEGDRSRIGQIT
jgi:hypothetical protein